MAHERRPTTAHVPLPTPPRWRTGAPWLIALVCALAASVAAREWSRFPGDVAIARALQSIEPAGGDPLLRLLNHAGTGVLAVALTVLWAVLLALARRPRLIAAFLVTSVLRLALPLIKAIAARPRPSPALVRVTEHATGSSFPSGHVFSAVLCYGALAVLLEFAGLPLWPRRVLQAACVAVLLLMCPARVAVGAHWPSDVLGGLLWGGVLLVGALWAVGRGRRAVVSRHLPAAVR